MEIALWLLFWAVVWGSFNSFFKWKIEKTHSKRYFWTSIFFLICALLALLIFRTNLTGSLWPLSLAWLLTTFAGFFLSDFFPFYKRIKNGKYYLSSLPSNIFLQQIMIVIAVRIISSYFGLKYFDFYFGIFFMLMHSPIVFLKWAKLRYLYLVLTLAGGTLFSYLIKNYGEPGIFLSFIFHYFLYIPIFYYLRDERKM